MGEHPTPSDSAQGQTALVRALKMLLRPLIKMLLSRGITYPIVNQWVKSIFVNVAEKDFKLPDKRQTDSRIHLLTGIHRKDVKRLRKETGSNDAPPETISFGALLVSRWTGLSEYLDNNSRPVPLPRQQNDSNSVSFEQLVASVNKDIRPRVVLDEWIRLGIVRVTDNIVYLNTDAFVPEKGFDELAYYFGRNLRDHIAAASNNLSGAEKRFFERSVYYDQLCQKSVNILNDLSKELGMNSLQAINRKALELQANDIEAGDTEQRMNFGIYFYNEASDINDDEKK